MRQSIASGQLPHLLFYGPPGTGKTSTIVAVARELYGNDFRKNGRYLELNASDDRGIKVVREKVKLFAQGAINSSESMPAFKIIVLDEADSMTNDAQSALRRMMEDYSKVTRFCLICNYVSRIIDPIASRCVKFRFSPLTKESMAARLSYIGSQENLRLDDDIIDTLLDCANGDLRKAINLMQSARQTGGKELTNDEIVAVAGVRSYFPFVFPDHSHLCVFSSHQRSSWRIFGRQLRAIVLILCGLRSRVSFCQDTQR